MKRQDEAYCKHGLAGDLAITVHINDIIKNIVRYYGRIIIISTLKII